MATKRQFSNQSGGVDADDRGRFSITVSSAGAWHLTATAPGYATQVYEEHEGFSSAVVLTDRAPATDLTFRLSPEASVSGTVLDDAGEAVRNASVSLLMVPPPSPDNTPDTMSVHGVTQTDDRGYYEFANLPQGNYRISVDAKPWYASNPQQSRDISATTGTTLQSPLDPSLDVAYAETWYPGVDDPSKAETLALHPGDNAEADFHMIPVPAIHLQVITPPSSTTSQGRTTVFPLAERVNPGTGNRMPTGSVSITTTPQGQTEIGGLAPGFYQIRLQGQGQESRTALVQVSEGGVHTVDFNEPSSDANITIRLDGVADEESAIQVGLINTETGERIFASNQRFGGEGGRPGRGLKQVDHPSERVMQIPPGRYEVVLAGRVGVYLTGMTAQSAEVTGRYVKVHNGDSTLTLHIARGRASVSGIASIAGKPVVGAMVLLVPAGLDDPSSLTLFARDQTNTDGSFDLPEVVPGQYILLAIENGWQVNWKDPSTLNRYLIHGVPLELKLASEVKQNIEAQAP
ncbi:carboxypeptidase-like regulatory domain-containing protein [Edaphobacter bradus]|uniref:carboxypeptidase-like regulatory domain-containing protein n=1 Tax=Edaphobacter bradus TaxID=2259016 RepID=UPI0037BEA69B